MKVNFLQKVCGLEIKKHVVSIESLYFNLCGVVDGKINELSTRNCGFVSSVVHFDLHNPEK